MHIKIFIKSETPVKLPIHYNHIIQAMIYNNISPELARFLHDRGFLFEKRVFKLFTFSRLLGEFMLDKNSGQIVFANNLALYISSPINEFCNQLGNYLLLNEKILLYNNNVTIEKLEIDHQRIEDEIIDLKVLSPITVYSTMKKGDGTIYTCYFEPGEKEFEQQLDNNLRKKYYVFHGKEAPQDPVRMTNIRSIKKHIIRYKDFTVKGYTCKFNLTGPRELLQIAVDAGVGSKNSQGFGCIKLD
ncbi:MAG: CRISPR-associated endoribonuclease Cas6 [Clostridia bacterium]|nr:CRISPR-associated endoribonuclease Cas6 [Clostridia bacterium]